ncbi:hypothetical protein MtrunA17_Chr3g0103051 [Medicago truncatula]|uniref:Transmembrane protein, putative n=1 Tax=Medicago truncatula TaxID=3880 RepID=G7IY70_MEDTR|nr:transmembrane protein, putative [Medicago truncatula]RHN67468.1 hypothetical protein MtrunA17_Chr3g0103051 [Medicago truncatula]
MNCPFSQTYCKIKKLLHIALKPKSGSHLYPAIDWSRYWLGAGAATHMAGNGWLKWCHMDCNFYGWMRLFHPFLLFVIGWWDYINCELKHLHMCCTRNT